MFIRAAVLIASVLAIAIPIGCGGGDDNGDGNAAATDGGSSSATSEPNESGGQANLDEVEINEAEEGDATASHDAFIRSVNKMCQQIGSKLGSEAAILIAKSSRKRSELISEIAAVEKIVIRRLEEELKKLRAFSVPSENAEGLKAVVVGYEQAIDEARNSPAGFVKAEDPYAKITAPAEKLGLDECPL